MNYSLKRALGVTVGLYVATFVVGIVSGVILGHDMSTMQDIPDSFWYIGMAAAVILTAPFTFWYFKNPKIESSAKNGLMFGLTAAILSFLLDLALVSLGSSNGDGLDMGDYYGDVRYWIVILLVIATATYVGHIKKPQAIAPNI